jgi:hypothetical protein
MVIFLKRRSAERLVAVTPYGFRSSTIGFVTGTRRPSDLSIATFSNCTSP